MKHGFFLVLIILFAAACHKNDPTDTQPVDKSLVLYLPQDGKSRDSSIYHATGIADNASFTFDRNNNANKASLFDSVKTYIRVPNSTVLDTLTNVTLAAWIKPISWAGTGSNPIITKEYTSEYFTAPYYQYHLGITGNKYSHAKSSLIFSLGIDEEYQYIASDDNTWTPEEWIHVAGTYDGNDMKLYINGELKKSLHISGNLGHYGNDVYIGRLGSGTAKPSNTPGSFDELRIYNRALSSDEIHKLYSDN